MSDRAALTLRMIAEAKARGATWAQIATVTGSPDGKTAKRAAKALARQAQRELLAARAQEAP
jgi:hypothetical protein